MMKVTARTETPGDFLELVDCAINHSYCLLCHFNVLFM